MSYRQRSLGSKKVEGNPVRLGIINENEAEPRSRTRATNIGSRSSIDNATRYLTPINTRSTPGAGNRLVTDRSSLSVTKRTPLQMALGRSSAIGAKKDLNDKANQQLAEQEIVEFCRSHNYDRVDNLQVDGPKRTFPLNSTEFRLLFTFIMKIYDPGFEELDAKTMAEKIPVILKTLSYPGHVSKQMFQTLGTKHSWTNVLAILKYLIHRANQLLLIGENWRSIGFSNQDEHGFTNTSVEADQLIRFDFFAKSYRSWELHGNDDYNEYLDELESRFYKREGLDRRELDKLPREVKEIRNHLQDSRAKKHQSDEEIKSSKDLLQKNRIDTAKLKDYVESAEKHKASKYEEVVMMKASNEALQESITSLEKAIADQVEVCRERGEINSDVHNIVEMLEARRNDEREVIKSLDNVMWEKEREMAKVVKNINDTCQCFNEKLINMGLYRTNIEVENYDDTKSFKLEPFADLNEVIEWLKLVECSWKRDKKIKDDELTNMQKQLDLLERDHKSKTDNLVQIKNNKVKISNNKSDKENTIKSEEISLKEKLGNLKEVIHLENTKDRKNLEELTGELNLLKDEEVKLIEKKCRTENHGRSLLIKARDKWIQDKRKAVEEFNEFKSSYEKAAKGRLDQINAESRAMVAFVANLRETLEVTKARDESGDKSPADNSTDLI